MEAKTEVLDDRDRDAEGQSAINSAMRPGDVMT